jgi:hypothetical protein
MLEMAEARGIEGAQRFTLFGIGYGQLAVAHEIRGLRP